MTEIRLVMRILVTAEIKEENFYDETEGKAIGLICILTQICSVVKINIVILGSPSKSV